jgi:hypothetical protein
MLRRLFTRDADGNWAKSMCQGRNGEIDLPDLAVRLPLTEIYDGVEFPQRPRLVGHEPDA